MGRKYFIPLAAASEPTGMPRSFGNVSMRRVGMNPSVTLPHHHQYRALPPSTCVHNSIKTMGRKYFRDQSETQPAACDGALFGMTVSVFVSLSSHISILSGGCARESNLWPRLTASNSHFSGHLESREKRFNSGPVPFFLKFHSHCAGLSGIWLGSFSTSPINLRKR